MDLKSLHLTGLKAGAEDGLVEGQFLAYASTWTKTPDSYGDIMAKGAFKDTLTSWKDSGNTLPLLYGHDMTDPFSNLGGIIDGKEDDHGFLVKGQLDMENPKAKQVYRMLKGKRINQLSFAYDVQEDAIIEVPKAAGSDAMQSVRELRKVKLYEVSIVPIGANQDTEVLAVKAATEAIEAKAGKTISTKNLESLKAARDAIDAVIASAADTVDTPKASQAGDVDKEQELKSAIAHTRSAQAVALALHATSL